MSLNKPINIDEYVSEIKKGNIAILSRAITLIESTRPEHRRISNQLINALLPGLTNDTIRIGITGVPGVGKSCFIESLGMHLIEAGNKVAVLAIDPSSSLNKGSILGDKTRMEKLSTNENSYIRPTASSGNLGGIAYKTREAMLLCEAAGYNVIIVETVGVGQSETNVSNITDFFLLLMLSGAGDELQGVKRGIMEMADSLVITKADGDNLGRAKLARAEYSRALHLFPPSASGWIPEVKVCSSQTGEGIGNIWELIEKYIRHQRSKGFFTNKRSEQNVMAFDQLLNDELHRYFVSKIKSNMDVDMVRKEVFAGLTNPYDAMRILIQNIE